MINFARLIKKIKNTLLACLYPDLLTLFWVCMGPARWSYPLRVITSLCYFWLTCSLPDTLTSFGVSATLGCFWLTWGRPDTLTPSSGWVLPYTVSDWPVAIQDKLVSRNGWNQTEGIFWSFVVGASWKAENYCCFELKLNLEVKDSLSN